MTTHAPDTDNYADEARDEFPRPYHWSETAMPEPPRTPPQLHKKADSEAIYGSTPFKSSLASIQNKDGRYPNTPLTEFLRKEFQGKLHREYPVIKFIEHVWNFKIEDLPKNVDSIYIPSKDVEEYHRSQYTASYGRLRVRNHGERGCYDPLQKICRDTLRQLGYDEDSCFIIRAMWDRTVSGSFAKLKPDFLICSALSRDERGLDAEDEYEDDMEGLDAEDVDRHNYKHHWNDAGGIGEIKKQPKRSRVKNPLCIYLSKLRLHAAASSSMLSSTASVPVLAKIPKRKRHASDVGMSSSSKRAKNADQPFSDLSDKELQTAKYLNELLSHHVRSYGTGFLLDQTKMTLWYCDRMGLVQSEPFDIFKNFEYLVLMVAALAKANLSTLGFCPFLELPSRHQDHTFDGVSLNLPDATDSEGERIGPVAFDLDVNKSRKLINGYGAIGRGTAVIPVKTIGNSRALFGDKNLRAKIAWPQEDRDAEDELIRKIRRAIDENDEARRYLKHIVDLKCSLTLSMEDVRLPRIFMDDVPLASSHRRMWRALVMEEYLPLQLVDSVDEFKEVFKHVLHGHRWAWEAAGVLHRDVSIYNVMFYRDTETGKVIGVLCDWDLAQERDRLGPDLFEIPTIAKTSGDGVHENTDGAVGTERKDHPPGQGTEIPEPLPRDAARYRTGTGPFMAIDLLTEKITPEHQYRYDLESFFYVLVWFCAGFRPESHDIEPITAWQTPNLTDIGSRKREFIVNDGERAQVLRSAHPECKNLASEWIDKLYLLFADLLGSTITIRNLQLKLDAAEKSNHLRKVERYHKKTQKAVDRMHKLVTFKSFMRRLRKT